MNGLLFVVALFVPYIKSEFLVTPSNVSLPVGSAAVFRCSHESTDAVISWRVNGSNLAMFPDVMDDDFHNGSAILTIPARAEYDGLEVMCVAFVDGSLPIIERTPVVIMTLLAGTMEPTRITTDGKLMTIDSEEFGEYPSDVILLFVPGAEAVFRCNHQSTDATTGWIVNGSNYNIETFPDISQETISDDGVQVNTLTITAKPQYNGTEVVCRAFFGMESPQYTLPAALLIMEGPLDEVIHLVRNGSTLLWNPPFSPDLTGVDPDIVYCVEVVDITCGRSLLISECDVTETTYTNDTLLPGYIYEYTVTPRSNVKGAANGTSVEIMEKFPNGSSMGHTVSMMNITELREDPQRIMACSLQRFSTRVSVHIKMPQLQEAIKPTSYSISLNSLDGFLTNDDRLEATNFNATEDVVLFRALVLPFRRLWNIQVFAHDCNKHPLIDEMELGTHDFYRISVTSSPGSGVVMVTGDIVPGLTSMGILVIVYSLTNDNRVIYHVAQHNAQHHQTHTITMGLPADKYEVAVFVIEEDGSPFCRAATTPKSVQIDDVGAIEVQSSIEYELLSTSAGVCITCTFLDESMQTDCVAVVHQRISELNSSGLMNIESSHKFTRSDDIAYGCIEGVNMTAYQIGVISGSRKEATVSMKPSKPSSTCSSLCQALVVVIMIILGLVLLIAFIFVYIGRKIQKVRLMQQTTISESVDVLESDSRYETVQLRIQRNIVGGTRAQVDTTVAAADQGLSSLHAISGEGHILDSAPSLPPPRSKDIDPVYTEAVIVPGSKTVHQSPAAEGVVYDDIKAFQNKDGQQYAIIGNLKTTGKLVDDPSLTVYSEIQHVLSSQQVQITDTSSQNMNTTQLKQDNNPTPKPVTTEHLLPELLNLASKWQSLGEALSLDEDRLDEIFTNNETDEACLEEMLVLYLARPDLNHSWEEIQNALEKIGEGTSVDQPEIPPREKSVTIQPTVPLDGDLTVHEDSQDDEECQKLENGKECDADSHQHESIPENDGESSQQELKEDRQQGANEEYMIMDSGTDDEAWIRNISPMNEYDNTNIIKPFLFSAEYEAPTVDQDEITPIPKSTGPEWKS